MAVDILYERLFNGSFIRWIFIRVILILLSNGFNILKCRLLFSGFFKISWIDILFIIIVLIIVGLERYVMMLWIVNDRVRLRIVASFAGLCISLRDILLIMIAKNTTLLASAYFGNFNMCVWSGLKVRRTISVFVSF